ncbi:hypothetical protein U9J35_21470 [Rossellomorea aquimaris]|nr:hypothetical protein [Rossellomorea aquimaris]WRP06389.1 hypothetical protein U9J35_21470 [Rossellomorea aquimaris]
MKNYVEERFGTEFKVEAKRLVDDTPTGALWTVKDWRYEIIALKDPNLRFSIIGVPDEANSDEVTVSYLECYYEPQLREFFKQEIEEITNGETIQTVHMSIYQTDLKEFPSLRYAELMPLENYLKSNDEPPFEINIELLRSIPRHQFSVNSKYVYAKKLADHLYSRNINESIMKKMAFRTYYIEPKNFTEKEKSVFLESIIPDYYKGEDNIPAESEDKYYEKDYVGMKDYLESIETKNGEIH